MQTGRVPVFFQAERGGRRPEALVAAARRGRDAKRLDAQHGRTAP